MTLVALNTGYPVLFNVILGHSVHLSRSDLYLQFAGRRAKRLEIWDSGLVVNYM